MSAPSTTAQPSSAAVTSAGELERRRVQRTLRERVRYRYVRPIVRPAEDGWRIASPCCSRNVDVKGDVIDIAWLKRLANGWRLYYKDHAAQCWRPYRDGRLTDLLETLRLDPDRRFWP